ncbi:MAG: sodium:glutamate symporter [Bacteroidales bacterium]|nr:sodium:glutamate symporter [Bacteroidales bacterium]
MNFTVWTLLIDVGLVSVLLMLGKLLRAKIRFIQKLFLPPSLIAGFGALLLGPEILGRITGGTWCLPLNPDTCATYSSLLIAFVFGCIPLTSTKMKGKQGSEGIGRMWVYSNAGMLLQWALGGALGLWVFSKLWDDVHPAFGIAMPAGFCGGHGTAAAMGTEFAKMSFEDMQSVSMTCATVGIVAAVVIGLAMIKWGTNHGKTSFIQKYNDLPDELRTGIIPKDKRDSIGEASFSAISLDSLTFNFATVCVIVLGGYGISKLIKYFWPALGVPVFICAFLVGLIVRKVSDKTGVSEYISPKMIGHMSGAFTDFLVAFGVASIKLAVVWKLLVPVLLLLAAGLLFTYLYVVLIGKRVAGDYWFEKAVFSWGWFTGTMSMSIALLRIVDPDMRTKCMDEYAYAYIYVAPVEIALIALAPLAFGSGLGWLYVALSTLGGVATLAVAGRKGWLKKKDKA